MNRAQQALITAVTVAPLLGAATTMWRAQGAVDARTMLLGAAVVLPLLIAIGTWSYARLARQPETRRHEWRADFECALQDFATRRGLTYISMPSKTGELRGLVEGVSVTVHPYVAYEEGPALVEVVARARASLHHVAVRRQWRPVPGDAAAGLLSIKTGDQEFDRLFKTRAHPPKAALAVLDDVTRAILRDRIALEGFDHERDVLRVRMRWSKATSGAPLAEIDEALRLTTVLAHRRSAASHAE